MHCLCCVFEQAEKNIYLEERLQVLQQQNEDLKIRIDKNIAVSRSVQFLKILLPSCFSDFSGDFLCARVCFILFDFWAFLGQATLGGERQPAGECGEGEQ